MERRSSPLSRLAAVLAAAALAGGWAASARADVAYAFASQTISNISITGTGLNAGPVTVVTQDAATQNGSGPSNSDGNDVAQAYLPTNGSPKSAENNFNRFAPGNPPVSGQTTPDGTFTRGDAQVIGAAGAIPTSAANVAESYLNVPTPVPTGAVNRETGLGGFTISFNVAPTANTTLGISYNFSNALAVFATGAGTATAAFQFNITIKDAAGNVVFNSNTPATNLSASAPPNSFTPATGFTTGSETLSGVNLTGGTTYTVTLSGTEQTSVAVPEPGAVTLVAASGVLALGVGAVRRRALRRAPK